VRYTPQDVRKPLLQTPSHNTKKSAIVLEKEDSLKKDSASSKDKKSLGKPSKDKKLTESSRKTSPSTKFGPFQLARQCKNPTSQYIVGIYQVHFGANSTL
jgi:hypothetical protein